MLKEKSCNVKRKPWTIYSGVFKTQSNIYDEVFFAKISILDVWLRSKYTLDKVKHLTIKSIYS